METDAISGINNFAPGYIDRDNEVIVGLQTDAPLKRIVNLYGGMRMAESALEQYGYTLNPEIEKHFRTYRKTHNDGVFDAIQSVADNEENIYLQSVSASYKDEGKTEDGKIGRHINYGVREFGMAAIMNGVALHGGYRIAYKAESHVFVRR